MMTGLICQSYVKACLRSNSAQRKHIYIPYYIYNIVDILFGVVKIKVDLYNILSFFLRTLFLDRLKNAIVTLINFIWSDSDFTLTVLAFGFDFRNVLNHYYYLRK